MRVRGDGRTLINASIGPIRPEASLFAGAWRRAYSASFSDMISPLREVLPKTAKMPLAL